MERFSLPDEDAQHSDGNLVEHRYLEQVIEAGNSLVDFERQAKQALEALRRRERFNMQFLLGVALLQHRKLPSLDFYPMRYAVNTEMVEPVENGELVRYREYDALLQSAQIVRTRVQQVQQSLITEFKAADKDYTVVQKLSPEQYVDAIMQLRGKLNLSNFINEEKTLEFGKALLALIG